jgi:Holliday junction resolvase RusA-like endonuclease
MITITIPGEMRGKGRPRFTSRGGFAKAYTDDKTKNAEAWVKHCAVTQAGSVPTDAAVSVAVAVEVVPPASWSKTKRASAIAGGFYPTSKPDLDNVVKLIADALNGIVWQDDKQIVRMVASKRYGPVAQAVLTVAEA